MRLATLPGAGRDGALVVVSRDLTRAVPAGVPTLQAALEDWAVVEPRLKALSEALNAGKAEGAIEFDPAAALAPLPRAWQWLDGSVFAAHGQLMHTAYKLTPAPHDGPLMYQGMSHQFLAPTADTPLPSEADGIDFEGEFGVIVDETPMGVSAAEARGHIRLLIQINDWSLRVSGAAEMRTGFGWIHAKPACTMAPVAVTPDELGDAWRDARIHLPLNVSWNDKPFGHADGGAMECGFDDLVAHAARTRSLCAGTVIGSGTVSNENFREVGSSCISEVRGMEMLDFGEPRTPFMKFGDRVRMEARAKDGSPLFGAIDQKVVQAKR